MKDEEKKFIKETIDDAIDKKFAAFDKKQETARKSDALSQDKKQEQQKKELLEELRELDKKGQATMAQKFELFKLSVKESQDVQNAWNDTKKSAQQIGKGVSTINRKIMMSNPLTAMLYENRDLFGAAWDITSGTLKTGFNIAKGAAGLLKAATKKKQEEAEQEEELNLPKPKFDTPETQAEVILQEKEEWQKKIDDIHDAVAKERKEGSKATTILAQGLTGLNKTMKLVSEGVQFIGSKQKLILAAVGLGAMGILALVSWLKGKTNEFYNPDNNQDGLTITPTQNQQKSQQLQEQSQSTNVADLTNEDLTKEIKQGGKIQQLDYKDFSKDKNPIKEISLAHKQGDISKSQYQLMVGATGGVGGKTGYIGPKPTKELTSFTTETEYNPIQFPVPTKVLYKNDAANDSTIVVQNTQNKVTITVSNIKKLIANLKENNEPYFVIAIAGKDYKISGDLKKFLKYESFEEHINTEAQNNWDKSINVLNEQRTQKQINKKGKQEAQDLKQRQKDIKFWDNVNEKFSNKKSEELDEKPIISSTSVNPEKAAQQQEQLSKKEEQQTEQVAQAPQTQQSTQAAPVVIAQNPATPVAWPDKNIPTGAYMHMVASYVDTNGVC